MGGTSTDQRGHVAAPAGRLTRSRRRWAGISLACLSLVAGITISPGIVSHPVNAAERTATTYTVDIDAMDVVWDASRQVAYASVHQDSAQFANQVVTIDVETGAVIANRALGTVPNQLAMSPDGSALYVGLDGAGKIQKFDLPDFTPSWSFTFGMYLSRTMLAGDIEVMPGTTDTVAVSRRVNGLSPSLAGVVVIDSGTARPVATPSHIGANSIVFGDDATKLYGSDTESSANEFQRFAIDSDGITETDTTGLGGSPLKYHDGLVYVAGGSILDPSGPDVVLEDTLGGGSYVEIDPAAGHVYYIDQNTAGTLSVEIDVYDLDTRLAIDSWQVPGHNGFGADLTWVGSGRLAYIELNHPRGSGGLLRIVLLEEEPDVGLGSLGEYTPVNPERIFDSRIALGQPSTEPLGPGTVSRIGITGKAGVPETGVSAVVMNVTVTEPTNPSFLSLWPSGVSQPTVSSLNYFPGDTRPNLVTLAVGADGSINASNGFGTAHVIMDVVGFYADLDGPAGGRYQSLTPSRFFDTRDGTGGVPVGALGPATSMSFNVLGRNGVPASGVTAIAMNVTVTEPSAFSFLTVSPGDLPSIPTVSNLNYAPAQTVPNLVIVRVPTNGIINFYNQFGSAHVIADVVGYYDFDRSTEAGRMVAYEPQRGYDSRTDNVGPHGPDFRFTLFFSDAQGQPERYAEAIVLNVTVTEPTAASYLSVYPDDACSPPAVSNLNFLPGQTVPNQVLVGLAPLRGCARAASAISIYNAFGNVHVIVDEFGAFTSAAIEELLADTTNRADASAAVRNALQLSSRR